MNETFVEKVIGSLKMGYEVRITKDNNEVVVSVLSKAPEAFGTQRGSFSMLYQFGKDETLARLLDYARGYIEKEIIE